MTMADVPKRLRALEKQFPRWTFRIVRSPRGDRIEAVRKDDGPGLYALISSDPDEIDLELRAALPGGSV